MKGSWGTNIADRLVGKLNFKGLERNKKEKLLYRFTPRTKTYSMTFLNDEFMMYKGLYNSQLYSLH